MTLKSQWRADDTNGLPLGAPLTLSSLLLVFLDLSLSLAQFTPEDSQIDEEEVCTSTETDIFEQFVYS